MQRSKVTVRVPATTANMGSGFDCIGLALDIWNDLTVEKADKFEVVTVGEGADRLPANATNLVVVGASKAFARAGIEMPALKFTCVNRIPFARGLGSSSAAVVSGIIAGIVLTGQEMPVEGKEELLNFASEVEGHPDNVGPCIYGGLQVGIHTGDRWYSSRIRLVDGIQAIVFLPDTILETSTSRAAVPDEVPRKDAVFNIGRAAILANAFATGNLKELRYAMQDRLHQTYRGACVPHLNPLIEAATEAGAHAAALSGAGPAVVAITSGAKGDLFSQLNGERFDNVVAEAMLRAAEGVGVKGRIFITVPSTKGAHVVQAAPPFSGNQIKHYGGVATDPLHVGGV
uniref:Homoserine kinase n=1 Tax=Chromera velia CCMP2878 TaxID=1169474 RepID=A0A0G4FVA6_9ALVE|mmetsp:Transcript_13393/g.26482  ORF Transcript_13393/g.26482 Transcript_13393/m.26482 type:complete len:344 (-) Transcript_13393:634-1665(-)|eukprot:Cvel_502.t1-p1 / transcript=Cvel_502.t1 / gene=Cvel_502 / organism=Chromera_velia_CCMP2878 / gene_product=Homoserine kinase, putative / transcript_product=Homoserine kinase, putative / location=Cvel_scaffold15:217894-219794(+) / protein_length=343 / sequence_SO=supercontig / SO=protein_coding / is_pseudo=false